jgi:hypothetical protein
LKTVTYLKKAEPNCNVRSEFFEAIHLTFGNEEQVTRRKLLARYPAYEFILAHHNINIVKTTDDEDT